MSRPDLAIIVALTGPAGPGLAENLARFAEEAGPRGEVVVVASGSTGIIPKGGARVIGRPVGRLAPELWRDGLLETDSTLVAFTTARMRPRPGWLAALRDRIEATGAAGVGGPIAPGAGLSGVDRAVALLRYANYFPPLPNQSAIEPPGDNALYRRDRLMRVRSSWRDGFWETEVHRALRDQGESLAMAEGAVVAFLGGDGLRAMIGQRFRHARRYAIGRSSGLGPAARSIRVATSPLVPPLLGWRIARTLRERDIDLRPWLAAGPAWLALATIWAIGEALGTWAGGPVATPEPERPNTNLPFRKAG